MPSPSSRRWRAASVCSVALTAIAALTACNSSDEAPAPTPPAAAYPTLDGQAPQVIAHRGFSGQYPEQTRIAYEKAADAGADMLEMDMHLTQDCQLVARHNAWLSDSTNVAHVPAFAGRQRNTPGREVAVGYDAAVHGGPAMLLIDQVDPQDPQSVLQALVVDGEDHTGDWAISDFTLEELRTQLKGRILDNRADRPTTHNDQHALLSAQEVIDIARAQSQVQGRTLAVYAEAKNPHWNNAQARANGCAGDYPFEQAILKLLEDNQLNTKAAPIYLQSFDPESLKVLRSLGMKAKAVQLFDGDSINFETGAVINITHDAQTFVTGRPYSWTLVGNPHTFAVMQTAEGLADIAEYADGIGPWKTQVLAHQVQPYFEGAKLADVNVLQDTGLVARAHAAGLVVHTFTMRSEASRLAGLFQGNPVQEYLAYFRVGVDGVFTDFPNHGVQAVQAFGAERQATAP